MHDSPDTPGRSEPRLLLATGDLVACTAGDSRAAVDLSVAASVGDCDRLRAGATVGPDGSASARICLEAPMALPDGLELEQRRRRDGLWEVVAGVELARVVLDWAQLTEDRQAMFASIQGRLGGWLIGLRHSLRLDASLRRLEPSVRAPGLLPGLVLWRHPRCGLRYTVEWDSRDCRAVPDSGWLVRLSNELVWWHRGPAGDWSALRRSLVFQRQELTVQAAWRVWPLRWLFGPQLPLPSVGFRFSVDGSRQFFGGNWSLSTSDRYTLGGAATGLRGFAPSRVGPSESAPPWFTGGFGSGDGRVWDGRRYLGSPGRWTLGIMASAPAPALLSHWLPPRLRFRAFVDTGAPSDEPDLPRASCGVGIACPIGSGARLEVNYCLPLIASVDDTLEPGLAVAVVAEC